MDKIFFVFICFSLGICSLSVEAQSGKYPSSQASHASDDFSRGVPGIVFSVFAIFLVVSIVYIWIKMQDEPNRKEQMQLWRTKSKEEQKLYVQELHRKGQSIAKISDNMGVTEFEIKQLLEK